jgi:hypothetical protein
MHPWHMKACTARLLRDLASYKLNPLEGRELRLYLSQREPSQLYLSPFARQNASLLESLLLSLPLALLQVAQLTLVSPA